MADRSIIVLTVLICVQLAYAEFKCEKPGKFIDSEDRSRFHECHFVGDKKFTYFHETCPKDTCFDGADETCDPDHCHSEPMPPPPPEMFTCSKPGKFMHVDLSLKGHYFKCVDANGKLYLYEYSCLPTKPCFVESKQACQVC